MNRKLCILTVLLTGLALQGQAGTRESLLREGGEAYKEGQFEKSSELFAEALGESPGDAEALFDLGASQYRQEDYEGAAARFRQAAESGGPALAPQAWYNLGNSQLALEQPQEAVNSYVEALKRDPSLREARHNLEMALQQLQQQQEQQEGDSGEEGDQDQQDQQQQDQQQQDQQQQDQQEQDQQEQDQQEQDQQEQQQQEQQQQDPQQEQGQQEQTPPPSAADSSAMAGDSTQVQPVSPEQLEQILKAVEAKEKEALEKQLQKLPASKRKVEKDW